MKELVRAEMCDAYPLDPPLAVDVGVGDDWSEAKSGWRAPPADDARRKSRLRALAAELQR